MLHTTSTGRTCSVQATAVSDDSELPQIELGPGQRSETNLQTAKQVCCRASAVLGTVQSRGRRNKETVRVSAMCMLLDDGANGVVFTVGECYSPGYSQG